MKYYLFSVYSSLEAKSNNKKLFEKEVCRPSAAHLDLDLIIDALTILFGTKAVITITITQ